MKTRIKNEDGIYSQVQLCPENLEDINTLAGYASVPLPSLEENLVAAEKHARSIVNGHGDADQTNDAHLVLTYCRLLRECLYDSGGDKIVTAAACLGVDLGRALERLAARPFEPKVVHATKTEKGLDKGRKTKARKTADRRKKITTAVKLRMTANKKDSLHAARNFVATQLGVSFDAVRRATATMKPRKKIKK